MLLGLVTYSVGKEHVTRPKSICVGGQLLLCNYDNLFFFSSFVEVTMVVFLCSRKSKVLRKNLTIYMVIPEMILK